KKSALAATGQRRDRRRSSIPTRWCAGPPACKCRTGHWPVRKGRRERRAESTARRVERNNVVKKVQEQLLPLAYPDGIKRILSKRGALNSRAVKWPAQNNSARSFCLSASIGTSAPSRFTCQKAQPLQAGAPWTAAPTRWIEPVVSAPTTVPSARTLA